MTMHTKTNGKERELRAAWQLPAGIHNKEFDYVSGEDSYSPRFFQYRGSWYDVCDGFMPTGNMPHGVAAWQGESYFSAVGIRYTSDYEAVVVTYCHW